MKFFFGIIALVGTASASFEAANQCYEDYERAIAQANGKEKCVVTETFAQCLGRAVEDLPAAATKSFDTLLMNAQKDVAALKCDTENLESPSIDIADGSMEIKVARRDADIKFYRYGRTSDVSIFDLDAKVAEMQAKIEAATVSTTADTKASVDAAIKTVGDMNAAFTSSVAEQMSSTVASLNGEVVTLQSKQDAVAASMAALKNELTSSTNQAIKSNSDTLTSSLTSTLTKLVNTETNKAKQAAEAAGAASQLAKTAAGKAFEQACASGGLKYDSSSGKCGGAGGTAGDGKSMQTAASSCKAIKAADSGSKDGMYWIKPDLGAEPTKTYCLQSIAGGGWTLVSSVNEGDVKCRGCADDKWSNTNNGQMNDGNNYAAKYGGNRPWESDSTFGSPGSAAMEDYKSSLYGSFTAKNMMVMNMPNGEQPDRWASRATVIQYTDSNFLTNYKNLQGYFKQYPPRYGCPKQGTNNIRVKYARGSGGTLDSMICPNCRGQTTQGYWSFSRCNWENSMFPFCQNKATGRDNEHFCIGASYVHGHGSCAANDFNAWDWHCGVTNYNSGWSNPKIGMFSTFMFLYRE